MKSPLVLLDGRVFYFGIIQGGTPGEGSPLDPLLRFIKQEGVPCSAERGQGLCPWTLPPLKRWTKLLFALRAAKSRLFIGDELGLAAHIGAQHLGDIHGAVSVEIVL